MSENTKTPEELAKLNQFRQAGGEFGDRPLRAPDPSQELGNGFRDPAYPLTVEVRLEKWDSRDNIQEVGVVEFDARALFDRKSVEDLESVVDGAGYRDWIYEQAVEAGLVEGHDGPFTVEEPEELEDYIEHRANSGMVDAYESADEILAAARLDALKTRRTKALEEAFGHLVAAGSGATIERRAENLAGGDVLVQGTQRVVVDGAKPSSLMPGFIMVETAFGCLFLSPDAEVTVEAF